MIKVGVFGAGGRMGMTVCQAVCDDPDLELVAAVDPHHVGIDVRQLGIRGGAIQVARTADALAAAGAEVAVDFTVIDAARENLEWCADHGVHAVVGTSGFSVEEVEKLAARFESSTANAAIVPNFAISAVLMMKFAELAAPYFDTAEIIELHHDDKVDAPSGTAIATAERMAEASARVGARPHHEDGARGRAWRRGRRRDPHPLRADARPGRAPGGAARHHGSDPHHPPGLLRPHVVHARCRARGQGGGRQARSLVRARHAPGVVSPDESRERVLAGTYECVARVGIGKTTVEDVARASGVSRATVYRLFPGGRDELLRDTVAWEMARFFVHLGAELGEAPDFETFLERALPFAREAVLAHAVLQKVLETEPERLMPLITVEQHRVLEYITAYFLPLLARDQAAGLIRPGVDLEMCAEYVARMALSLIASPGRHDLEDPDEVRRLVRDELLGGVLPERRAATLRQEVVYCLTHGRCRGQPTPSGALRSHGRDAGRRRTPHLHRPVRAGQDHARRRGAGGGLFARHALPLLRRQARPRAAHDRGRVAAHHARRSSTPRPWRRRSPTRWSPRSSPRRASSRGHAALRFLLEHEPAAVLAHLAFAPGDRVLTDVGDALAPAFARWLPEPDAIRAGDWLARVLRSYVLMPEPTVDLTDARERAPSCPTSSSPGSLRPTLVESR